MTIQYHHGGLDMFRLTGSVFPSAAKPALLSAALTLALSLLLYWDVFPGLTSLARSGLVFQDSNAWTVFAGLVGFLIVFRTSQAYSRFWDGCTACHVMRAEWFDACSSLMAFCKHSTVDKEDVAAFQHTLIRLFSMLHALALAEIEDPTEEDAEHHERKAAFGYDLIDVDAIDRTSLMTIKDSECKVELVFQWIQQLVVENISTGVMSIPAPILSRAFQEMANGMVQFHEAVKISTIPFPFPYAQSCDILLMLHSCVTPFVMCQWVHNPWWAFILSFTQVFVLWCLNFISREIQNPFGSDANDLDSNEMQEVMNKQLELLLMPSTMRTPKINREVLKCLPVNDNDTESSCRSPARKSFTAVWNDGEVPEYGSDPRPRGRISTCSGISIGTAGGSTAAESACSAASDLKLPDCLADSISKSAGAEPEVEIASSHSSGSRAEGRAGSPEPRSAEAGGTRSAGRPGGADVVLHSTMGRLQQMRHSAYNVIWPHSAGTQAPAGASCSPAASPLGSPLRRPRPSPCTAAGFEAGAAGLGAAATPASAVLLPPARHRGPSLGTGTGSLGVGSLEAVSEVSNSSELDSSREFRPTLRVGRAQEPRGRTGFPRLRSLGGDIPCTMDDTVVVGV